jgi:hypothetical protein
MTMKKQLDRKHLVLDRQTLRVLQPSELDHAAGGMMNPTKSACGPSTCEACPG